MAAVDPNSAFARALVASLRALGLRDVCLSPGSRNTPLTLAFAEDPEIRHWVHVDERSAGFFAVGLARTSGRPVALVSTSGTAAAEYHPAIVEARQSRVPILVLTADRPPELQDVGAPQAIDQVKLYGDSVKWYHGASPPDADSVRFVPGLAAHAWGEAIESPAGPVHLNLPFREPLAAAGSGAASGPVASPPMVHVGNRVPQRDVVEQLRASLAGRRALFAVGALPHPGDARAVDRLAASVGAVVCADIQSGLRFGAADSAVLGYADPLVDAGALDLETPEVVLRWGSLPTSKPLWRWLEDHPEVPQLLIDPGAHRDPLSTAHTVVRCDVGSTAEALMGAAAAPETWAAGWKQYDERAQAALALVLAEEPFPNEPAIAALVAEHAPPGTALFAGSSMPIRDLDSFGGLHRTPRHVVANRGANGIDGSIATALGMAADRPCVALIGDVAALHDVGSLTAVARFGLPLTIVVVHNDGGGIFHLLPQADPSRVPAELFETVYGTPHGTNLPAVAASLGLGASRAETPEELIEQLALPQPRLIEVRTDRHHIAPLRRRIRSAVRNALGS